MNGNEPTYDDWTNLETCVVYVCITNDQESYRFWRGQAETFREEAPSHHLVLERFWTPSHAAVMTLSDDLKMRFGWNHPFDGELAKNPAQPGVYSELLDVALNRVNWKEIAEELLRSLEPENEPDPEGEKTHEPEEEAAGSEAPKENHDKGPKGPRFELGRVVSTPGALAAIGHEDIANALGRHHRGDWGECGPEDWQENESSLREGFRLFSVYRSRDGEKFWVITEADRSATTVLLPDEY